MRYFIGAIVALSLCFSGTSHAQDPQVRNVIFLIGDGMGLAHVAATTINQGYEPLNLERAQYIGLAKTYSANNRVTDSAASGTALATGHKTNNGTIGLDADKKRVESILEKAERAGLATGLAVTVSVTHATPAAFIAHVESRKEEERIAEFFLENEVDVFFGGGLKYFSKREDGRNLVNELTAKGYSILSSLDQAEKIQSGKVGVLAAEGALANVADGRGDFLPRATAKAIDLLSKSSDKGFFLMVEGSQIDYLAHDNDIVKLIPEVKDFDAAVKVAFDFADRNPGTLVIVTADHETGGLTIPSGKPDFLLPEQGVKYLFSTTGHSGTFVPVYAYGAGAEHFTGFMENTDIPKKIARLLGVQ